MSCAFVFSQNLSYPKPLYGLLKVSQCCFSHLYDFYHVRHQINNTVLNHTIHESSKHLR